MAFDFDALSPAIQAAIGDRIVDITAKTLQGIQAVIARGFREQMSSREMAKILEQTIGMNGPQAHAAMNFRQRMIEQELSSLALSRAMSRYVNRKIKERAITIARTETMIVLNKGQALALAQAKAQRFLPQDSMKVWILTDDEKLCPICAAVEGEVVPVDEEFSIGDPPAHPRCRCTFGFKRGEPNRLD